MGFLTTKPTSHRTQLTAQIDNLHSETSNLPKQAFSKKLDLGFSKRTTPELEKLTTLPRAAASKIIQLSGQTDSKLSALADKSAELVDQYKGVPRLLRPGRASGKAILAQIKSLNEEAKNVLSESQKQIDTLMRGD